ncbi:hypothetical protein EJ110_NYTH16201 [Nymphaea thermarum]|nr:hypothetical protein EJ110_NYTH16201 [Nymphaea thermarum]
MEASKWEQDQLDHARIPAPFGLSLEIQLDDWVLCQIYKKRTSLQKGMQRSKQHDEVTSSPSDEATFASLFVGDDQHSESNVNQWTAVLDLNAGY